MKGCKLSMRCIRKILEYRLEKSISAEKTSRALGISKGSVINVLRRFQASNLSWPLASDLSDELLDSTLYPRSTCSARTTQALPDIQYIEQELARPHVTLQCLWDEYHSSHPSGLKRSAFYRYYSSHMPPTVSMKMHHKGGDKLFVDYSGKGLFYRDKESGSVIPVELFVCSWGASSYCYAEATHSQSQEDFVWSHCRAFTYFGSVPHALVPDNLKSAIIKPDRYNPLINRLFSCLCDHYNTVVLPARVRKPQDKAVVESNVLHIQRFILARLRNHQFFSLAQINDAIKEELRQFNDRPMKDYGNQTRLQRFETLDKPYAQPLPAVPFKIVMIRDGVKVARDYHISFKKHFYSVPFQYVGKRVEVRHCGALLEIYHANTRLCTHLASYREYGYTTKTEHMPQKHQFIRGWSPAYFLDQAQTIGPATTVVIEQTLNRSFHVEQGYKAAMGVLKLAKQYTPQRLENACKRALIFKNVKCATIKSILTNNLDLKPIVMNKSPQKDAIIMHDNIRGANQYT